VFSGVLGLELELAVAAALAAADDELDRKSVV
jgi:hypothetical protein